MTEKLSRREAIAAGAAFAATAAALPQEAEAGQPHMHKALEHLQEAKRQLEAAGRNKGGHRAKAHRLVHEAIEEVKAGIRVGRA